LEKNFRFFGPLAAPFSDDPIGRGRKLLFASTGTTRGVTKVRHRVSDTDSLTGLEFIKDKSDTEFWKDVAGKIGSKGLSRARSETAGAGINQFRH
jgi:hypothetical protein